MKSRTPYRSNCVHFKKSKLRVWNFKRNNLRREQFVEKKIV